MLVSTEYLERASAAWLLFLFLYMILQANSSAACVKIWGTQMLLFILNGFVRISPASMLTGGTCLLFFNAGLELLKKLHHCGFCSSTSCWLIRLIVNFVFVRSADIAIELKF